MLTRTHRSPTVLCDTRLPIHCCQARQQLCSPKALPARKFNYLASCSVDRLCAPRTSHNWRTRNLVVRELLNHCRVDSHVGPPIHYVITMAISQGKPHLPCLLPPFDLPVPLLVIAAVLRDEQNSRDQEWAKRKHQYNQRETRDQGIVIFLYFRTPSCYQKWHEEQCRCDQQEAAPSLVPWPLRIGQVDHLCQRRLCG